MGMGKVSSAERVPSQLPEHIGRYRAERLLGQGRSGSVYLAHDKQTGRPVAVKVLQAELVSQPENAEAYLTEARMVASLAHPHIVPVQEAGSDGKFPCFIVSQYVEGVDLRRCTAAQHHNPLETAKIIITLAGALDYAHRKHLCHLNLRPGKILVDSAQKPWLFADDFLRVERLAGDRWIPGNPYYLSPEQVAGKQALVGPLSDIYSLGVVFYQLLTGQGPYRSEGGVRLCEEILNPSNAPPSEVDDGVPRGFDHICARAMARSTRERYQTMNELAEDLTCSVISRRSQ
jgi:serine/threonine-protein kinase